MLEYFSLLFKSLKSRRITSFLTIGECSKAFANLNKHKGENNERQDEGVNRKEDRGWRRIESRERDQRGVGLGS